MVFNFSIKDFAWSLIIFLAITHDNVTCRDLHNKYKRQCRKLVGRKT